MNDCVDDDPFIRQAAYDTMNSVLLKSSHDEFEQIADAGHRLAIALGNTRRQSPEAIRRLIPRLLRDADPRVQLVGVMWVGEEVLPEYAPAVEELLNKSGSNRMLFEGCLAALHEIAWRRPRAEG